jgi:hypothetical protein
MIIVGMALVAAMLWPDLPFSKRTVAAILGVANKVHANASRTKAIIAISVALCIYAAIWALQGDAPMFLAMALPELASWFATFEIATLAEALIAVGSAFVALRASGLRGAIKARYRARRQRRVRPAEKKSVNDDEPGGLALAA